MYVGSIVNALSNVKFLMKRRILVCRFKMGKVEQFEEVAKDPMGNLLKEFHERYKQGL